MDTLQTADRELTATLRGHLKTLESQEDRLIDLAVDGTMPSEKLRTRLNDITLKKASSASASKEPRATCGRELNAC